MANVKEKTNGQPPSLLNLSYVGKVGKTYEDGIVIPPQKIEIFARFNRFGRGIVMKKHKGGDTSNLKRGERKQLNRSNLTTHARRMIQGAGDFFEWQVNEQNGQSSVMITLTYGRNVPDHPTAKKQLQNLIRNLKGYGHFKHFAWVAQLQTGERALKQGKTSYRAKYGSAIHFHILTNAIDVNLVRKHWTRIVNKWEKNSGLQPQRISGVNITAVYNASHYISRYISNETKSGNIIGNLWGISSELRNEIGLKDGTPIETTNFEWDEFVNAFRLNKPRNEYDVREKEYYHSVYSVPDFENNPIVFAKNVPSVLREFVRWKRNKIRQQRNSEPEMALFMKYLNEYRLFYSQPIVVL